MATQMIIITMVVVETAVTASFVMTVSPILKASCFLQVPALVLTTSPSQFTTTSSVDGRFESSSSTKSSYSSSSSWLGSSGSGSAGSELSSGLAWIFIVGSFNYSWVISYWCFTLNLYPPLSDVVYWLDEPSLFLTGWKDIKISNSAGIKNFLPK